MNLLILIAWIAVFVLDFIEYLQGLSPTWVMVFCPLAVVIVDNFVHLFDD